MRTKTLILSYAAHLVVLFFLIVIVTFIKRDFDLKLNLLISAGYITLLSIYFIILIAVIDSHEKKESKNLTKKIKKDSPIKYWLLVIIYIGLIFSFSSISDIPFISALAEMDPRKFSLHLIEYLGLGYLMYLAFYTTGFSRKKAAFFTILLCFSIAYMDETYQLSIPGRRFNPIDMYFDWAGTTIGIFISAVLKRNRS